ncbi:MAG TPA: tetratricopeptide repeat protein [Candidatus Hydrogenedentes bacterium]|nr:tetratricopeptide repeat protein [Candidatus Hydrogenedentota bacterium]
MDDRRKTQEAGIPVPALMTAIVLAGVLAYANTFTNDFVWDDASSVLVNKHVQDPTEFWQLFREDQHPFGRGAGNFYRPLVAASFMADFLISYSAPAPDAPQRPIPDLSPFLFHLTNLAWHILAALFLCAILLRLGASAWICAVVPILFIIHPLHTEAVAYISGRADPMAAALGFLGIWLSLRDETAQQRWAGIIGGSLAFTAALMCKESAMIFPFLLVLIVLLRPIDGKTAKNLRFCRAIPIGLWFVILMTYAVLRSTVLRFASSPPPPSTFGQRIIECGQSFAWYWKLIFIPTGLHMERSLDHTPLMAAPIGALLLLAMITGFFWALWRGRRLVALGIGWFLIAWFPISGLIPLNAPMAEHWMYVPLAGFLCALACLTEPLLTHPWPRRAVLAGVCAAIPALLTMTAIRNNDWRDNETLFRDTLAKNPKSSRVHFNLAVTYQDISKNIPGAKRHYEAVVALYKEKKGPLGPGGNEPFWDEELEAHLSLGRILAGRRDYAQAARHYETVLRITPDERHTDMVAKAALNMGQIALAGGQTNRAVDFFKKALAANPALRQAIEQMIAAPGNS